MMPAAACRRPPNRPPTIRWLAVLACLGGLAATSACTEQGADDREAAEVPPPVVARSAAAASDGVTLALEQALWEQRAPAFVRDSLWTLARRVYDERRYQPLWLGPDGLQPRARAVVRAVCRVERHALPLSAYPLAFLDSTLGAVRRNRTDAALARLDLLLTSALLSYGDDMLTGYADPRRSDPAWQAVVGTAGVDSALQQLLGAKQLAVALDSLAPAADDYGGLVAALARYGEIAERGGWDSVPSDRLLRRGSRGPAVEALRARLAATGDLPAGAAAATDRYDAAVARAVAGAQRRHGLVADGVAGPATLAALNVSVTARIAQIAASLERQRWLPGALGGRHVVASVPARRLVAYAGASERLALALDLSDSLAERLPPALTDSLASVVLVPAAGPPVANRPAAHRSSGVRSAELPLVRVALRQAPEDGAAGPGALVFPLALDSALVLRGTPGPSGNGGLAAADSMAIVVERPLVLAAYLLARDSAGLRAALDRGESRRLPLAARVPLYLVHPTAYLADGELRFRQAMTSRDEALARQLASPAPSPAADETCARVELATFDLSR